MAAVSVTTCAICGAQVLPAQRYRLWDEGASPTELCRQLKIAVGEGNVDRPRMKSTFSCRSCRSSLFTLVRLKERFEKCQTELLRKMLKNRCPKPSSPRPIPPEKRPRGSPLTRTGVSPLTKKCLPDAAVTTPPRGSLAREPKTRHCSIGYVKVPAANPTVPVQAISRRQLFPKTTFPTSTSRIPVPRPVIPKKPTGSMPRPVFTSSSIPTHQLTTKPISAEEVLRPGPLRETIIKCLLLELDQQCKDLCQKKAFCSILRGLQPSELTAFSFERLVDEWRLKAPLLLQFLSAVASVSQSSDGIIPPNTLPGLCTAGAVLLRLRNIHMGALHHLIGLILFHGNSSKLAHLRLNHLCVSVSPDTTLGMVDRLAAAFDEKVMKWMDNIKNYHSGDKDVLCSYQIIGDNVDLHQRATHHSMDRKDRDHHWFHLYAVQDRICGQSLPDVNPTADVANLPLQTFLPSANDCHQLRKEFGILISRVLVNNLSFFAQLKELIPEHIQHRHSADTSKKSEIVPLGVLTKSEQRGDDMIDIMTFIHKYVPRKPNGDLIPIFFGGDQLTRERAGGAQDARLQAPDSERRLQGVKPNIEDWHALVTFYQVIWNHLYNPDSFCDKGTLKQLSNLINRPSIPKKVKNNFTSVQDFFGVVLDAHITVAAMQFFGMAKLSDKPTLRIFQGDLCTATNPEKEKYLSVCMDAFVTQFALHHVQTLQDENVTSTDGVFEYACSVIGLGLMARNFSDATHEGDGERLMRCWKLFMLHFKADSRTKYAVEAFNLIAQVNATLTPLMACRLVWNRTCNLRGGEGNNIPLDLQNEHLNRTFKDDINTFRANISDRSVARSSQAIGPLTSILKTMDGLLNVKKPSGRHVGPSVQRDFDSLMHVLQEQRVCQVIDGRKHRAFPNFHADPFANIRKKPDAFQKWLIQRRKAITIEHQLLNGVF